VTPAEDWRAVAGRFTALAEGVPAGRWEAPAPVPGWTARDVVGHLVGWVPAFLEGGTGTAFPPRPSVDEEPAAAWRAVADGVQALLDDPAAGERVLSNPNTGDVPLPQAVAQFVTTDVFLHAWDLARATGQDATLDPDRCAALVEGMEPWEDAMRASGQYGPRVAVPEDADPQTRLLGFIGRDPHWTPPT
jgi:uncharacterized protein (TIGR03086 family)